MNLLINRLKLRGLKQESVETSFDPSLDEIVLEYLSHKSPREVGLMLARALASAASKALIDEQRYKITLDDLFDSHDINAGNKMGFVW